MIIDFFLWILPINGVNYLIFHVDKIRFYHVPGEKAFMMGDEMTEVDCSVFGTLCQFIYHQEDQVLGGLVQGISVIFL